VPPGPTKEPAKDNQKLQTAENPQRKFLFGVQRNKISDLQERQKSTADNAAKFQNASKTGEAKPQQATQDKTARDRPEQREKQTPTEEKPVSNKQEHVIDFSTKILTFPKKEEYFRYDPMTPGLSEAITKSSTLGSF
jgi:hypothetical protein